MNYFGCRLFPVSLLVGLLCALTASAIIIRHDRDDALYIALGAKYGAVGHLNEQVECTLIAPQWVIGAAHTIEDNNPFVNLYVVFGGRRYEVEKAFLHPDRVRGTVDSSADMALLKLAQPVEGVAPVLLYEKDDEVGKVITIVGRGGSGNGLTGQTTPKGRILRGATNRIEATLENSILMTFDMPPGGTDLEGSSGGGDSGGPALLEQDGKLYILGVNSFNSGDEGTTASKYGTFEGYARISTRRKWILDTIAADGPSTFWGSLTRPKSEGAWPSTPAGRLAAAFFKAYNRGEHAPLIRFYLDNVMPRPNRTPQERASGWREDFVKTYGPFKVYGYKQSGPLRIAAYIYSERAKVWRGLLFDVTPDKPHKIRNLSIGEISPP